ncbi:MAG: CPBP family intramembrane glutamic endopeptidase, partial [Pseudomonadota bacterium]
MAGAFRAFGWPDLAAAGTVRSEAQRERAHILWRLWLLIELCILYIGVPILLYHLVHGERVPLFILLPPVLLAFVIVLLWDRSFLLRRELVQGMPWRELLSILVVFLIGGGMVAAYVQQEMPRAFLSFPTQRPETWQRVMVLYPLASVIAQELVYRTFFFHRYGALFDGLPWVMIFANGMLFGVAHMLFGNWVAVIGTGVIGCLLAYRYAATRSLWAVVIEHT